jgi:hypothetical protein
MLTDDFDHIEQCNEPLITTTSGGLIRSLMHIMGPIRNSEIPSILYDLSNCSSVDPGAVLLLCYAYELSLVQQRKVLITGSGPLIEELREHFRYYRERDPQKRDSSKHNGLYPLRGIENKENMLSALEQWAESVQRGTAATPEQVALWQMQIAEVTTNAFQHGPVHKQQQLFRPVSIVAGKASGQIVQLAALDFGSTIPRVITEVAKRNGIKNEDGALIKFACQKGITSRSVKQNQGAGLYTLQQTVTGSPQGILQILSGNGLALFSNGQEFVKTLDNDDTSPMLDGTLTIINLQINGGAL